MNWNQSHTSSVSHVGRLTHQISGRYLEACREKKARTWNAGQTDKLTDTTFVLIYATLPEGEGA